MSGIIKDNEGRSSGLVKSGATTFDDDKIQSNIALLGFKAAVNGSLAKYNLQDQIIDEYADASGIDTSASTDEDLDSGAYHGRGGVTTPTVTGGSTAVDGDYTVHTFTANGNFITDTAMTVDYLIVGGGGGGGDTSGGAGDGGGGGGAGGVLYATSQSFSAATFAAVVGAGGAASANGVASSFNSQTAGYGGAGGNNNGSGTSGGATDGSGGGSGARNTSEGGGNGNGNSGGNAYASDDAGGGGGGRGAAGQDAPSGSEGGDGGAGLSNSITGSAVYYGAGGGGGIQAVSSNYGVGGSSLGGNGGTGGQAATNGTDGSGSGGGGAGSSSYGTGGDGGNGIVIVRRPTTIPNPADGTDLTLQSLDTTAMTEPDNADMVMLMENKHGTNTLNTDIKGYISRDSGANFTQGTLVDEGTWGTNKKILAFHDLDISGQPSGTSMCYKITTHNQSEDSKEAYIHATSIGWK